MIPKDTRAYSTLSLHQEKSLRDHDCADDSHMRINADIPDRIPPAPQAAAPARSVTLHQFGPG